MLQPQTNVPRESQQGALARILGVQGVATAQPQRNPLILPSQGLTPQSNSFSTSIVNQGLVQPNISPVPPQNVSEVHTQGDGHNHSKPTTTGSSRYNSLSDRSRSFYDGFKGYMQDTHKLGVNLASGGRTQAEQNHLYGQGRTRPGNKVTWTKNSHHIGGNAMDIVGPNWYKDAKQNLLVANEMRKYATANPNYGAGFLKLSKDPNHVQFVY
jgi:hypothetical protein